ncbi:hypothetical protein [Methylocystis echinoides]|uniref:hypothetical protein n=1 Tax=Methylocystis echinoides TaxID=29468 RepID=UPI00342BA050
MQELFGKNGGEPQHWAAADVQAFLKRFVQGEKMVMIFAERGLGAFPDFKLTKGGGSPFFEIRFDLEPNRPPQVRLFGRFIATDCFVITSIGEKGPTDTKGKTKTIDVAAHRKVCQRTFDNCDLTRTPWIPDPEGSMSSVEIAK